jgi:hypothetical protein
LDRYSELVGALLQLGQLLSTSLGITAAGTDSASCLVICKKKKRKATQYHPWKTYDHICT